mmetsp:Transcript_9419/g.14623  ORF Transcript_9419/g.14623 Transcript_9419/m.14623 type:complete len:113 (-) Transcript_9419:100-438(-)
MAPARSVTVLMAETSVSTNSVATHAECSYIPPRNSTISSFDREKISLTVGLGLSLISCDHYRLDLSVEEIYLHKIRGSSTKALPSEPQNFVCCLLAYMEQIQIKCRNSQDNH